MSRETTYSVEEIGIMIVLGSKKLLLNHAFYKAILWGSQKKITVGYTSGPKKGNFGINDNCTRGQIVTFLYRAQ